MFETARIKLTLWYLLIIMVISFIFSFAIYRMIVGELTSGFHRAESRFRTRSFVLPTNPDQLFFLVEELQSAKQRVLYRLALTNGLILIGSAVASYLLAGKTLHPIKEALENERRFVADASHELKTPLTALKSSIEVTLRDKNLNIPKMTQALKSNLVDVNDLAMLTENLLSLAQLEKSGNGFHPQLIDTREIYAAIKRRFSTIAKKKKIKLTLPNTNIQLNADEESLTKLLSILVDNAIKYTPINGSVHVSENVHKRHLLIKVVDTGIGMGQHELPHIFDRFFRADNARTKTDSPGYGLGLSIAKQIVQLHNGYITVKSKIDHGTTFTVCLPLNIP